MRCFQISADGTVVSDQSYFYATNAQGDVIAIYDENGVKIYTYAYDAWGNLIEGREVAAGGAAAAAVNPLRYRGYYFDAETGLYYLNSRYYNPQWGRFLNADTYISTGTGLIGYNMYAYCNNNPVMYIDPTGDISKEQVGAIVGMFFGPLPQILVYVFMPDEEEHYARNENNTIAIPKTRDEVPGDWKASNGEGNREVGPKANAHQFTSPDHSNVKYTSPDGTMEAIYDKNGDLVTDPRDVGTYNFYPSEKIFGFFGHGVMDILPWIIWGNSDTDTTTPLQRVKGLVGIYG